jgi:hypothetical protein
MVSGNAGMPWMSEQPRYLLINTCYINKLNSKKIQSSCENSKLENC